MTVHLTITRRRCVGAIVSGAIAGAHALCHSAKGRAGDDVPWLADIQRPPARLPEDAPRLPHLLVDAAGKPITTRQEWEQRRDELRRWWLQFLGPLASAPVVAPQFRVLAQAEVDGVVRQRIEYEVEPEVSTEAYLMRPKEVSRPRPGVVVMHSTVRHSIHQPAGVQGAREKAFGLHLARRGYVTLCPRNFLWPNNMTIKPHEQTEWFQQRHPESKGMAKMLYDLRVAVELLSKLDFVDADKLGCVGHSLGGKEALYLAALEPRIEVAVSSEGGIGIPFSNWDAPWYLGATVHDESFRHHHHELLALVAPKPFLLIGGDSADGDRSWPYIEAVLPVYRLYGPTARVGLLNHESGHAVPPKAERAIYDWFDTYLPVKE